MIVSQFYREETEICGAGFKDTQQGRNTAGSRSASSEGLLLSLDHSALSLDYVFFRAEGLITNGKKERLLKVELLQAT